MWPDVENGSVVWKLHKFNEPSRVVSVIVGEYPMKTGNEIAQLIVRINSKQVSVFGWGVSSPNLPIFFKDLTKIFLVIFAYKPLKMLFLCAKWRFLIYF